MKKYEPFRQLKDPSALTPYEQNIWELRQQGLNNHEIGKELNQLAGSIASRIKVIKEKVELQNELRAVN